MSLRRRLEKLEASESSAGGRGDPLALSREALRLLSDEELEALEEALDSDQGGDGSFEELYAVVGERSRRALDAYTDAIEAVRSGRVPPVGNLARSQPGQDNALGLVRRIQASPGDEEARREWDRRDGYRIWKHRPKERRRGC